MSDNYGDIRSEAKALVEKFVELEVEHQAMLAFNRALAESGDLDDIHSWTNEKKALELQVYSDQWRGEIASWFADITEMFDDLADLPDPAPLRSEAEGLYGALAQLAGPSGHTDIADGTVHGPAEAFEKLSVIPTMLVDWEGHAAEAFKLNFIPPLERVAFHEFEAVVSLRSPLIAAAYMWEKAREDVSNLIDEANSALDDYSGGKDSADAVLALGIIGAIVAVAAVPFTGGTSAALYWTMAGSAIAVTGAVVGHPNEPEKELDISGDSPADIAQSLRDAIWKLKLQLLEHELFISRQIRTLSDQINGYTAPKGTPPIPRDPPYYSTEHSYSESTVHEFALPRPLLADATPGNVNDDGYLGTPK